MVKIRFLGACQEVGRSGVLIESEETGDAVLCDYGTKMDDNEQLFPEHVSGRQISAIVLTHAHIDHSGGIPLFYISGSVPLYCTELTFKVTEILLQDMLNISTAFLPFERPELTKMTRYANFLKYSERKKIGKKTWITLYNAGHIPGSAMVLVEMDGKKILYTGDINTTATKLLSPLDPVEIPPIDAIITETTYGTIDHPDRGELEAKFVEKVKETVAGQGIVLIPAFGVARSQELLMVLYRDVEFPHPVVVDGMARKIAHLYTKYPSMLKDPSALENAVKSAKFIAERQSNNDRQKAMAGPGVIIAPSGMLKGGTARIYAERIFNDAKNAIFLVSYQVEETPGRILIETNQFVFDDPTKNQPASAKVDQFDFSSHSGQSELVELLEKLKFIAEKNVYCVHGDAKVMTEFAEVIKNKGFKTETPVKGQTFNI